MSPELVFAAERFNGDTEFEEPHQRYGGSAGAEVFRAELAFEQAGGVSRQSAAYVRWVQQSLNKILGLRLAEDGVTGVRTRSAVRSFQQKSGLLDDGIVGAKTEAALIAAGAPTLPGTTTPGSTGTGAGARIDSHAQQALQQMSKINHAPIAGQAQAMLAGIQGGGNLGGIYADSHEVAMRLADKVSRGRGQLIPEVADAVVAVNSANPSSPALVVFRNQIRHDTPRLGIALLKSGSTLQLARNLPDEFKRVAPEKAARDRLVAEAEGDFFDIAEELLDLAFPVLSSYLPKGRPLDQTEINVAKAVFDPSLDYGRIGVSSVTGLGNRAFTLYIPDIQFFNGIPILMPGVTVLNMGAGPFDNPASNPGLLIHELVHSWQSQHHPIPWAYETNSVVSQYYASLMGGNSYCYKPGGSFASYAAEQIAQSVQNGFLDSSHTHQSQIMSHIKAVPVGAFSPLNVASLMFPRWEIRGPGINCP